MGLSAAPRSFASSSGWESPLASRSNSQEKEMGKIASRGMVFLRDREEEKNLIAHHRNNAVLLRGRQPVSSFGRKFSGSKKKNSGAKKETSLGASSLFIIKPPMRVKRER